MSEKEKEILQSKIICLEELLESCKTYGGIRPSREMLFVLNTIRNRIKLEAEKLKEIKKNE